jgi:hypothetical protein
LQSGFKAEVEEVIKDRKEQNQDKGKERSGRMVERIVPRSQVGEAEHGESLWTEKSRIKREGRNTGREETKRKMPESQGVRYKGGRSRAELKNGVRRSVWRSAC